MLSFNYTVCHFLYYAECRYAKCRGSLRLPIFRNIFFFYRLTWVVFCRCIEDVIEQKIDFSSF